ncbi:S-layer homology domain-containing protein [Paenibacillus sp. sgz500958]|uniref:S-layer homology domain-containing protein n=1 Tax=Paenibacillus sp. sgz500958 TaxID=3242475 RepID=UPI0036D28B35
MQRIKRPFLWLLLAAMVVSLIPAGLARPVSAAVTSTQYFSPDDNDLRSTISLTQSTLTRAAVYKTSSSIMTITGSFSQVTASTMKVKVEQLTQSGSNWVTDSAHVILGAVNVDSTNGLGNRFTTSGLSLFSGYNKITFSGMQGLLERSESFYVLYDQIPYIQSLQVIGGGSNAINLNEGTQVVVSNPSVTLKGLVANATKVTVAVNGGTALQTTLLEDGTFFSPALALKSGNNNMVIVIQNASDSITIKRSLYYFDPAKPFTDLKIVQGDGSVAKPFIVSDLLDGTPTITSAEDGTTHIIGQVLVPYNSTDFENNAVITINNSATPSTFNILKSYGVDATTGKWVENVGDKNDEIIIPAADGVTPAYRLVTFRTTYVIPASSTQVIVGVKYTAGNFQASKLGTYSYLPGEIVISKLYYLKGYSGTGDVALASKLALDKAQVDSGNFYILVKGNTNLSGKTLSAAYLPLSPNLVSLTPVTVGVTGIGTDEQVYQVTGFSTGQQSVRFKFNGSASKTDVTITYVTKSYIYVESLYDGQTYSFSSDMTNTLSIKGEFLGFENIESTQMFINGISDSVTMDLGVTTTQTKFNKTMPIQQAGPLVYGENTIVLVGISKDALGNRREIRKELRIYVIDTNGSTLKSFHPVLKNGPAFTSAKLSDYTADALGKILNLTTDFLYKDEKYVTNQQDYDIVLRGGGATILNIYDGSQIMFSTNVSGAGEMLKPAYKLIPVDSFTYGSKTYGYTYAGNSSDFMLRLTGFKFDAPGSHVYTLELINSTGARTTQRLEVQREVTPYRILSPVATVGDQIVVNKNFVRFDIEAEGATKVMIDKYEATKRADIKDRFVYDFVGLKPDKATAIKIQIIRADSTLNATVNVYYASAVQIDTQYMAEKVATKYSVFNKGLTLSFPKGTLMKGYTTSGAAKYYPDTKLLFGIADPKDGVVERKNDYGNTINVDLDARTPLGATGIDIPDELTQYFTSNASTINFSRVSDIYWISGGLGEKGNKGVTGYIAATNGLAPYSTEGYFTRYDYERKIVPSQRGELTLSFGNNIVDEVGSTVTVFRYTDKGVWENVGGEVDTKSHTVTVPFDEFGYYTVMKLRRGYNDITNHPWARNILNGLYSKGIMENLRADQFGADDTTTRGEFATLLVEGLNIPLDYNEDQQTFFDIVPESSAATWDYAHIETAARAGIVTGLSDGFFGATISLTREQAAVMIARALKLKMSLNNDKLLTSLSKSFVDTGSMEFYSRPAIEAVSKAKIMEGNPITVTGQKKPVYNFNPKGKLTRAEAGKIAVALLQKSTAIFPKNFN